MNRISFVPGSLFQVAVVAAVPVLVVVLAGRRGPGGELDRWALALNRGNAWERVAGLEALDALTGMDDLGRLDRLRRACADADPRVRRRAAELLGPWGAKAVPTLAGLLADADDGVVRAAAAALASTGSTTAVAPLLGLLGKGDILLFQPTGEADTRAPWAGKVECPPFRDPDRVRAAAEALRTLASEQAVDGLLDALRVADAGLVPDLERALAACAGLDAPRDGYSGEDDPAARVRWWRAWRHRSAGLSRGQWLVRALADPEPRVRASAARSLGQHGGPASVGALLAALEDPVTPVRIAALESVRKLTGLDLPIDPAGPAVERADGVAAWKSWWAACVGDMTRIHAANSGSCPPHPRTWLVPALRHASPRVRASAARKLGRAGDRQDVAALLPLLNDPAGGVREAAAQALGLLTPHDR